MKDEEINQKAISIYPEKHGTMSSLEYRILDDKRAAYVKGWEDAESQLELVRQPNPWHKTPPSTPDKEAGRIEGESYIVFVNGEIHKATYEGYGRWTLENGKFETENKFTEVYWMPIPEFKKG